VREENGVSEGNQGNPFSMRLFEFGDQTNRYGLRQFHGKGINGFKITIWQPCGGCHPWRSGLCNGAFGTDTPQDRTICNRHGISRAVT
jgi:hypothetical protein